MGKRSITHLTHYYPRFKTLSGGEVAVLKLTAELDRMGVKSTILTRGYSERCNELLDPKVEIRVVGPPWNWLSGNHLIDSFLDVWFAPIPLSLLPKQTDGIIFHSEASPFALWWAKKVKRTTKTCVYFCYQPPRFAYDLLQTTTTGYSGLGRLVPAYAAAHRWFDRRWVDSTDAIWTFSTAYKEWCEELYQCEDVRRIPPGIDFDHFGAGESTFLRQKWNLTVDTIILVTVNKLIPRKNVDVFIKVIRNLRDRGCSVKAFIVGDGPDRPRLELLAQQEGLEHDVVFAGYVSDENLPKYYTGADVYLFLEKNVPFGMTVLEAGASGCPVIAPRGGATTETILHGETGFLIDEQLSIAEICEKVLAIVMDSEVKQSMRKRAREHARLFTWQRCAEQVYNEFYETTLRI